jgi:hypothetical protein
MKFLKATWCKPCCSFADYFLVVSAETVVVSAETTVVVSGVTTVVESTVVVEESVVVVVSSPELQAAKAPIAKTNNNFFIVRFCVGIKINVSQNL